MDAALIPPQRLRLIHLHRLLQRQRNRHAIILAAIIRERQRANERRQRRWWVRPWLERRVLFGHYHTLMQELERESQGDFVNYLRMPPEMFQELLLRVSARIQKNSRYIAPIFPFLLIPLFLQICMFLKCLLNHQFDIQTWYLSTIIQSLNNKITHYTYFTYFACDFILLMIIWYNIKNYISSVCRSRPSLDPGLKLAITLRYIATGNSYKSLQYSFRVAHNTIAVFIPEVCQAIVDELQDEVFKFPTTQDEWREVADKFGKRWNFHNACGALDGKHVAIRAPRKSGTLYYNYKGYFSIILLGLVDADYKFLWADVGSQGSCSDCQIFNHGALRPSLESGAIGFPDPAPLPNDDRKIPFFILGDDAFPLRKWLMKPFSHRGLTDEERIFNYRTSRARRVVENAFGILAHRWRCLLSTMQQQPAIVTKIVMACLCLHNIMRLRYQALHNNDLDRDAPNGEVIPGPWRDNNVLEDMNNVVGGNMATREAKQLRIYLKHYYNNVGSLPWQDLMI